MPVQTRPWYDFTGSGNTTPAQANLTGIADQDADATRQLLTQLAQYNQQYGEAFRRQSDAGRGYDAVIAGTAPSVAQAQLQQGVGQIAQQQQAQASGATGQNAAIARVAAMQNTGAAQAEANQHAALIRATEVAQARQQQAAIYGQQAGEAGGMYGTNVSGAAGFAAPAAAAAGAERKAEQDELAANRAFWSNLIGSVGKAAAAGG